MSINGMNAATNNNPAWSAAKANQQPAPTPASETPPANKSAEPASNGNATNTQPPLTPMPPGVSARESRTDTFTPSNKLNVPNSGDNAPANARSQDASQDASQNGSKSVVPAQVDSINNENGQQPALTPMPPGVRNPAESVSKPEDTGNAGNAANRGQNTQPLEQQPAQQPPLTPMPPGAPNPAAPNANAPTSDVAPANDPNVPTIRANVGGFQIDTAALNPADSGESKKERKNDSKLSIGAPVDVSVKQLNMEETALNMAKASLAPDADKGDIKDKAKEILAANGLSTKQARKMDGATELNVKSREVTAADIAWNQAKASLAPDADKDDIKDKTKEILKANGISLKEAGKTQVDVPVSVTADGAQVPGAVQNVAAPVQPFAPQDPLAVALAAATAQPQTPFSLPAQASQPAVPNLGAQILSAVQQDPLVQQRQLALQQQPITNPVDAALSSIGLGRSGSFERAVGLANIDPNIARQIAGGLAGVLG